LNGSVEGIGEGIQNMTIKIALMASALLIVVGCAHASETAVAPAFPAEDSTLDYTADAASGAYLQVEGGRLWYMDSATDGAPVLLLHPFTGTHEVMIHQYRALSAAGFRPIVLDGRNAGFSDTMPNSTATDVSDIDALLDELGLDRIHLVGSAAGGMQALRYAVTRPERTASLTLGGTIAGLSDPSFTPNQKRLVPTEFLNLPPEMKELGPSYRFANPQGIARWLEIVSRSASGKLEKMSEADRAEYRRNAFQGGMTLEVFDQFSRPTLLILALLQKS
jgi:pimeloyl-ACP methyl ester carboxylesterase